MNIPCVECSASMPNIKCKARLFMDNVYLTSIIDQIDFYMLDDFLHWIFMGDSKVCWIYHEL